MVNCVYFCRGPLAGEKEKGGGDVIKSERKKVTIITEAKSFFKQRKNKQTVVCAFLLHRIVC